MDVEDTIILKESLILGDEEAESKENEEDETREGSQKEHESLFDRLQQLVSFMIENEKSKILKEDLNDYTLRAVQVEDQAPVQAKGITIEQWSNSDSKDIDDEDGSEEKGILTAFLLRYK